MREKRVKVKLTRPEVKIDLPEIPQKTDEQVNHPQHYGGDTEYETIKVIKAWTTSEEYVGFLKGNAIKYLSRAGKKDSAVQDIDKAIWYMGKLKEELNSKKDILIF